MFFPMGTEKKIKIKGGSGREKKALQHKIRCVEKSKRELYYPPLLLPSTPLFPNPKPQAPNFVYSQQTPPKQSVY